MANGTRHDRTFKGYHWIVTNPKIFEGKPIIKGTRFSVAFVLGCLAEGMTPEEIQKTYGTFPKASLPEVLHFAEQLTDRPIGPNVAARR